jgi:hypothetical protein
MLARRLNGMSRIVKFAVFVFFTAALTINCGQSGPTKTADEVIVKTSNLDVYFSRLRPFKNTYIIFGGMEQTRGDAFSRISLSGLPIRAARSIYASYPDFHLCKSAGAPLAQSSVVDLDIVPASSGVLKTLRKTLAQHKASIYEGGDRVCIELDGELLKLTSAIVREVGENIIGVMPPQVHHDYFFVESAKLIDAEEALRGG